MLKLVRRAALALAALLACGGAIAQDDLGALLASGGGGFDATPDCVQVRAYVDRDAYHAGEKARIAVEMRIDPAVHVNGNVPTLDYQIATEITWDQVPPGFSLGAITWPKPKMAAFEFTMGEKIAVYEGTVRAHLAVEIPKVEPGSYKIEGTFRSQGCTHQTCYGPQTDPVKVTIRVVPAEEETQPINEEKFAPPKKAEGAQADGAPEVALGGAPSEPPPDAPAAAQVAAPDPEPATDHAATGTAPAGLVLVETAGDFDCKVAKKDGLEGKPILLVYVLAFGIGLFLTLTPCVLPLVPITIGYFSRQRQDGGRPVVMASLYVLGLALVYSTLGTVAALSGSLFGAALQNPWVLGGITAILVALALSMFGILPDLQIPSALQSRLGGGRSGRLGAAFMGGAMGLIAAPCVGPGVVSLLTYVAKLGATMPKLQAAALGGSLFFTLALGLGAPFFVVGMGAASIRPGAWMVTVKKVFGFAILATALWFARPLIGSQVFGAGLALVLAGAAIFLFLHARNGGGRGLRLATRSIAAVSGVAAIAVVLVLTGLLSMPGSAGAGPRFAPYSDDALARAATEGRPVVIDFGAEWCTLCKELEHRVFPHPDVKPRLEKFVLLRADMTDEKDPRVEALRRKFDVGGLPTIVFLDGSGREVREYRLAGFEPPEVFAERCRCALAPQVAGQ